MSDLLSNRQSPGEEALVGAYQLLRRIGAGGMGEVWLAEHVWLHRRAAIKLLHPTSSRCRDVENRLLHESRVATEIADPGIVQIFDWGRHHDGRAYIAMELLEGETLDARIRRHGALSIEAALRFMRQIARAVGIAHARGIVHCDLKPENVFLVRDPEVPGGERARILDFGLAKRTTDRGVYTQTSEGTPAFMAPEQCRDPARVDPRSDVYALGCVLHALVTGVPPFEADDVDVLIAMQLCAPAPRASLRAPGLPQPVDELIARCLDKDPGRRFTSGRELADAIDALIRRLEEAER